jgi:ankyrin repeat protein
MPFMKTTLALATAALAALAAAPVLAQSGAALAKLGPPAVTLRYNDVMTAVLYGDRAAVSQLLELGRWVDKPDSNGLTPLMAAVLGRDADMVELLLQRGADPNLQAPGGDVALEMARGIGDGASESLLLKAGARR